MGDSQAATEPERGDPLERRRDRRLILSLSGPVILDNLLLNSVRMLSLMFVGHLGPAAIGAVGLTTQLVMMGMAFFMALGVGSTALVARFRGSGERDLANRVVQQSLLASVALGIVSAAAGYIFAEPLLRLLGAGDDIVGAGLLFFRLSFMTLIFTAPGITLASCLRGIGDTRTPLNINAVASLISLGLLYWLIYGGLGIPPLGMAGAALAIMGARVISLVLLLYSLFAGRRWIRLTRRGLTRLDLDLLRRIAGIGFPNALEQITMRGGQLIYTRLIVGMGTAVFAAHQIGLNVSSLAFMPGFGMGAAATTLVGQSLGQRDPDRAERLGLETQKLGILLTGAVGLFFIVLAPQLVSLYSRDPEVIALGTTVLRLLALAQPGIGTWFVLAGALRGAGDTRWPLYITMVCIWVIRLGLTYLFVQVFGWGLREVWIAVVLDHLARGSLVYMRFRAGRWKELRV